MPNSEAPRPVGRSASNSLGARLRRAASLPPKNQFVAAIDFDGTICDGDNVLEGRRMGEPFEGAREVLRQLQEAGARIVIHTCRARAPQGQLDPDGLPYNGSGKHVEDYLRHYDIPFDEVTALKPMAGVYVDDKGLRFEGNWNAIATELLAMAYRHKWNERSAPKRISASGARDLEAKK